MIQRMHRVPYKYRMSVHWETIHQHRDTIDETQLGRTDEENKEQLHY